MCKTVRVLALPLLVAFLCTGPLGAESTPQALEWLEKLKKSYDKSYRVGYQANMNITQGGQAIAMAMDGVTTQADREHMRMDLKVVMSMGQMELNMNMLGVLDGESLWLEADNPMANGKQVTRIPADQVKEFAKGGAGLGAGVGGVDPVAQIEQMVEIFDFDLAGVSDGLVTLKATLPDDATAELQQMLPEGESPGEFSLVLDEKTGFPRSMRIGGETPFMVMTFEDVEFVKTGSLDPAIFKYTPPEGAQVLDMGARIAVDE